MVQRGGFAAPDNETPDQALVRLGRAIYQNEQIIKSANPNSAEFKKAKAALETLRKQFDDANAKANAGRAATKKAAADKAKAKAQEDLQRAEALGDEEKAKAARDKIKKAEQDALAAGEKEKQDAANKDSDGDGIPDVKDNLPNYPNPDQKTGTATTAKPKVTTASTAKPGAGGTGDTGGTGGADDKQLWISYLRTTFASLEDKAQKAELDRLFDTAKKGKWDEKTFMEALKNTAWWQTTLPSLRQFLLESKDPRNASTFAEKVKNNIDSITAKLEALGLGQKIDPVTGRAVDNTDFIKGIALKAVENNWTDSQLENYLSTRGDILFTGGGTIGSYYDRVKQTAYLYGINLDDNMKKAINTSLLDPLDGRDVNYWLNSVKEMAYDAPQYKPFAESLKAGRSLYEVTSSYRNQMASLLEVDSTAISWDDLMSKVVDKTTGNARTFADFTKQLKQDPLWQYTRNAKETYSGMALDLAKMFGFAG